MALETKSPVFLRLDDLWVSINWQRGSIY